MPANGETVTVATNPSVPVDISLHLLKREMALGGVFRPPGGGTSRGASPVSDGLVPVFQGLFPIPRNRGPCTEP